MAWCRVCPRIHSTRCAQSFARGSVKVPESGPCPDGFRLHGGRGHCRFGQPVPRACFVGRKTDRPLMDIIFGGSRNVSGIWFSFVVRFVVPRKGLGTIQSVVLFVEFPTRMCIRCSFAGTRGRSSGQNSLIPVETSCQRCVHCFICFESGPPAETGAMPSGSETSTVASLCSPQIRRVVKATPPKSFSL